MITLVLTATAKDRLGWLSRASPRDAGLYEAGIDGEINKTADACHAFDSSSSGLAGFATMQIGWMICAALDSVFSACTVKSAGLASVGCRVKTATWVAFGSRCALQGSTGGYVG